MKRGMSNLGVTLMVLLVIIVVAGGAYYLLDKQNKTESNLQSQIDDLKGKVNQPASTTNTSSTTADTTTTAGSDATVNSYSNPTYGYALEYPKEWTIKQANTLESSTDAVKNSNIQFYSGSTLKLSIITESKTKASGQTLSQYASDLSPKDKTTISGKTTYTIGSLEGYKELVTVSDPASVALYYFAESDTYFFNFLSKEKTESAEIKAILASFKLS